MNIISLKSQRVKTRAQRRRFDAALTKNAKVRLPKDYPWKVLGSLTTDLAGYLLEDDIALLSQIIRDRDITAVSILADWWGLQNVSIRPETDLSHISILRAKYQLSAILKKFRFDTEKHVRKAKALEKFFQAEEVCASYNHSGYKDLCWGATEEDACVFTYAKSFLEKLLGNLSPTKQIVTFWSRHGPGSNLDTCEGESSSYFKYENWPYSCTKAALPYARFLIETDKRWLGYLDDSYRERHNLPKHAVLDQKVFWENVLKVVEGNRITFVPKDARTERSIAIEPAINLMLQLGVDGYIRSRLKRYDIDLDDQEKNQVMALQGSLDPSLRGYVTLDLAMASDTISLKLCEKLLPWQWYRYLCAIRSPKGTIGDETIEYSKISSMGNGFTFVLESAIFAALSFGAIKAQSGSCDFKRDLSVYGDDVIVRQDVSDLVVRTLNNAGFTINTEKSFFKGPVRESCGSDWILGKPVRPVLLKDTPTDVMELFVDINRLQRNLHLRWGIEESKTVKMMKRWIPPQFKGSVGPVSDTEFESHLHSSRPSGYYDNCLWEYSRLVRKPVAMKAPNFLARKLMHDLRGEKIAPGFVSRRKAISGGSRFKVCKSYSYTLGESYSIADYWQSNYAEHIPTWRTN